MSRKYKGFLYAFISLCASATIPIVTKICIIRGGNPISILLMRFIIVSLFFIIYMRVKNISWRVSRKNFYVLLGLGFAYVNVALLFFLAMMYISPSVGSLLLYTYPVMVMIGAYFILGENFSFQKGISLIVALGGCVFVLWSPVVEIDYRGVVLALLTALSYAIYIIGNRKILDDVKPVVCTAYMSVFCTIAFSIYGLFTNNIDFHFDFITYLAAFILAFWCTIVGILCLFKSLILIGATKTSIICTFEPVVTLFLSYILLHDKITWVQIVGGILIVSSVLFLQKEPTVNRDSLNREE